MKLLILALALAAPGLAFAYPNPNVTLQQTAADMVDTIWPQPYVAPVVLADATLKAGMK